MENIVLFSTGLDELMLTSLATILQDVPQHGLASASALKYQCCRCWYRKPVCNQAGGTTWPWQPTPLIALVPVLEPGTGLLPGDISLAASRLSHHWSSGSCAAFPTHSQCVDMLVPAAYPCGRRALLAASSEASPYPIPGCPMPPFWGWCSLCHSQYPADIGADP